MVDKGHIGSLARLAGTNSYAITYAYDRAGDRLLRMSYRLTNARLWSAMAWIISALVALPLTAICMWVENALAPLPWSRLVHVFIQFYDQIPYTRDDTYFLWAVKTALLIQAGIPYSVLVQVAHAGPSCLGNSAGGKPRIELARLEVID